MRNRLKVLCFHPALAPYRVDLFNLLAAFADLEMVLMQANLLTQTFDQAALRARLKFPVFYARKISIRRRAVPVGCISRVRREKPDVVLAYECSPVTLMLILARMFLRLKFRLWTSFDDSPALVASRRGVRRLVRDWTMRHVDGVIVPSGEAEAAYRAAVRLPRRLSFAVVPIIHDTASLRHDEAAAFAEGAAWRSEAVPQDWTRLVLYVGRLSPEKNLGWLIAQMATAPQGTGLMLVGDGPLRSELEAQVAAAGMGGRVRFAGRLEGIALYGAMAVSDVLALASTSETFGAVVAEGLVWGTPVVVSEFVGAKSLVTSENGRVFALTPDSFAEALRTVPMPKPERRPLLPCDLRTAVEACVRKMEKRNSDFAEAALTLHQRMSRGTLVKHRINRS